MSCCGPGVDGPVGPGVNDWRRDPNGVVLARGVTRVAGGQGHAAEENQAKPSQT